MIPSVLLVCLPVWLQLHGASAIICKICRHTGLSMVPPNAPNSLMIFDGRNDSCVEEDIMCSPSEDYCVSSSARVSERFWVQKGCISSGEGGELRGCTDEVLDFTDSRRLPVGVPAERIKMKVCVCNNEDVCNVGPVSSFLTNPSEAPKKRNGSLPGNVSINSAPLGSHRFVGNSMTSAFSLMLLLASEAFLLACLIS